MCSRHQCLHVRVQAPFLQCGVCQRLSSRQRSWVSGVHVHADQASTVLCTTLHAVDRGGVLRTCAAHMLAQGGAVKQYKGLECPLDGFELVLFSLSGQVRACCVSALPSSAVRVGNAHC